MIGLVVVGLLLNACGTTANAVNLTNTAPNTAAAAGTTSMTIGNTGDPVRGQLLFQGAGTCSSCHDVTNGVTMVGPSLKGIASRASSRIPGKSAAQYLHDHILTPNDFIPSGFQPNVMPPTFGQTLTGQQIDDLVAYLLTLK